MSMFVERLITIYLRQSIVMFRDKCH